MAELNNISSALAELLKTSGIEKYALSVSEGEKRELNTEETSFSLFRTTLGQRVSLSVFLDGKKGSSSGTDFTSEGLKKVVDDAVSGAESSSPDEANDIAEKQEPKVFHSGPYDADMELLYSRVSESFDEIKADFPKIRLMQVVAAHDKGHTIYLNSNGTEFESFNGLYSVFYEFAGNDGERTTGLSYCSLLMSDLEKPILTQGLLRKQLEDTEKSLSTYPVEGKFEGEVILTPNALGEFGSFLVDNFMSSGVIMDGTSLWLDKIGERVASDKISISLKTEDERLAISDHFTGDGYRSENVELIEKGVLKSHLLNLYAAKKTERPVTKNSGQLFVMGAGDSNLEDMIKGIKRGLIVDGFSGGMPGANGEFSGVAKNSFYIEDGEIRGAVMETMISGNLVDMFSNVTSLSAELISDGGSLLPYMATSGITISGK